MTVDEVIKRIQEIIANADDCERAHGMEDQLREDVLQAINDGCGDYRTIAGLALSTRNIPFTRYYA